VELETAVQLFSARFETAGLPPEAKGAFERAYRVYRSGETGKIPWDEVAPPQSEDLVDLEALEGEDLRRCGEASLGQVVWIVLNGGLGTSMKMDRAKSLLPVKGRLTFLDLIARHVLALRERWGRRIPVLFMNSATTRGDTLRALEPHHLAQAGGEEPDLPLDFMQHRFPRLREEDGLPYGDPAAEGSWAPPGHGNLYLALQGSGVLDELLDRGLRWALVSNADNLGASFHSGILGFVVSQGLELVMEVTAKTAADVKGGTLIRRRGRLELLEIAQVPEEHLDDFQDLAIFPVFNTNNLWVDLRALRDRLDRGPVDLPIIVNRKRVGTSAVIQLESAMGAAIGAFSKARGVLVPRRRFAPVKTTDDLLVRRSDVYLPGNASPLVPNPSRDPSLGPPVVRLDPTHYGSVPNLDLRIPAAPSLLRAKRFEVRGDVRFGRDVVVVGEVRIDSGGRQPLWIEDGATLSG
jgi:UTP--glucose-1-phosphate uridylyltransferase